MYIIFLALCLQYVVNQPKCSSGGIPRYLPALEQQHLLLDMCEYFQGPNLTFSLQSSSSIISLQMKYRFTEQKHNLGLILSIAKSNSTVSMLGLTSSGRYYIYYSSISTPHNITAKQIPPQLVQCTNHAISPNGTVFAITCQHPSLNKFAIAYSSLDRDDWSIEYTSKLVISVKRQIQFITERYVTVVISHENNSYIQLWDIQYGRIIHVYDRSFLLLKILNIMDVEMIKSNLYILDYETGVYQFQFGNVNLYLLRVFKFMRYSKMSVNFDSLVISKKGSVTQFSGRNTFKYEAVGSQIVKQLKISSEYVIAYTDYQIIGYLRGKHTPYFIRSSQNHQVSGLFITNTKILQSISTKGSTEMSFQQVDLNHPYMSIPYNVPNNTEIMVVGISQVFDLQQSCRMTFTLIRTEQKNMNIFQNIQRRNSTQNIYMNRPGRAELDLTPYGMGPNLTYQVFRFEEDINLTTEVLKIRQIKQVILEELDPYTIKGTYFSESCGLYRSYCPLAIDTEQNILIFQSCTITQDYFGQPQKINCTQRLTQYKYGEYSHYQLLQPEDMSNQFYEVSVVVHIPNQIMIRKFEMSESQLKLLLTAVIVIDNISEHGKMNISQMQFDEDTNYFYILFSDYKEIQVYELQDIINEVNLVKIGKINVESFNKRYFAPKSIVLDNDGMLWIKNYDQIFVVDPRWIGINGQVEIISIINTTNKYISTYNYTITIVQSQPPLQLFQGVASIGASSDTKYLVIEDAFDVLLMCSVNHLYQVDINQLQPLPMYGSHVPIEYKDRYIQSLGNSQVFVSLENVNNNTKMHVIYDLSSLSLTSTYYQSLQTKNTSIPLFFHLGFSNPIVLFIQQKIESQLISFQISKTPKLLLTVQEMVDQSQSQYVILNVMNQLDFMTHFIVLIISNSPQNLTRGAKYPYFTVTFNALDKYLEMDTTGWVAGNVLSTTYACKNCFDPYQSGEPFIDVRGKLWVEDVLHVAGGEQFKVVEKQRGQTVAIAKQNLIYIYNAENLQIEAMYQLTPQQSDYIIQFVINNQLKLIVATVSDQNLMISLVVYSINTLKGFQLSRLQLPTVLYVMNMEYKQNVVILLDFINVYIINIDADGNSYVVDYINEPEAEGTICWAEIVPPVINYTEYSLIITLCNEGVTFISFSLEEDGSILKIINKQTISLKADLNNLNIVLPTDALFRRTLTDQSSDGKYLTIIMVINKFNSIQWLFTTKNRVVISEIKVMKILQRYGDFNPTGEISVDFQRRFLVMSYFGYYEAEYQYINAVYDMMDLFKSSSYNICYVMEAVSNNLADRAKFTPERNLLVLSEDGFHIQKIDVQNKFRAVVHYQAKLETQPLFVVPSTPVSSIVIELNIHGIDVIDIGWKVALIVMGSLIGLVIVVCLVKIRLQEYRKRKKLIPLLQDYEEYEEDMAEEVAEMKKQQRNSITSSVQSDDNVINASERGSIPI